jgi:hypothetical protein
MFCMSNRVVLRSVICRPLSPGDRGNSGRIPAICTSCTLETETAGLLETETTFAVQGNMPVRLKMYVHIHIIVCICMSEL